MIKIEVTIDPRTIGPGTAIHTDIGRAVSTSLEQMTIDETTALNSFLRYVAANENVSRASLESGVRKKFKVAQIPTIHRNDFPNVISFVIELVHEQEDNRA